MKQAVIAIEDHYFYSHIGINLKRIIKTIWVDLVSLSFAQGASTITQQTAKLFLLSSDKKIIRKIKFCGLLCYSTSTLSKRNSSGFSN